MKRKQLLERLGTDYAPMWAIVEPCIREAEDKNIVSVSIVDPEKNGKMIHPTVLFMNMHNLAKLSLEVIIDGVAAYETPWLAIPLVLRLFSNATGLMTKELSVVQTAIVLAIYDATTTDETVHADDTYVFNNTQSILTKRGEQNITRTIYDKALNELIEFKCIRLRDGEYQLKQKVLVKDF